nr:hypothetical protein [Streptomyces sp. DSM 40971]
MLAAELSVVLGTRALLIARYGVRRRDGLLRPVLLHPLPNSARRRRRRPRSAMIV